MKLILFLSAVALCLCQFARAREIQGVIVYSSKNRFIMNKQVIVNIDDKILQNLNRAKGGYAFYPTNDFESFSALLAEDRSKIKVKDLVEWVANNTDGYISPGSYIGSFEINLSSGHTIVFNGGTESNIDGPRTKYESLALMLPAPYSFVVEGNGDIKLNGEVKTLVEIETLVRHRLTIVPHEEMDIKLMDSSGMASAAALFLILKELQVKTRIK